MNNHSCTASAGNVMSLGGLVKVSTAAILDASAIKRMSVARLRMRWLSKVGAIVCVVFGLASCSSSGPATSYYTLLADKNATLVKFNKKMLPSIGVALVGLPGYLDNTSIVSIDNKQKLNVSGYHAWAEPLDEAATRVLASNLRLMLAQDISAFPWDMRLRPDWQLRVQLEQFDGSRDDAVSIAANWVLYNVNSKTLVTSGQFSGSQNLAANHYAGYVEGLNQLLNALSVDIAKSLAQI